MNFQKTLILFLLTLLASCKVVSDNGDDSSSSESYGSISFNVMWSTDEEYLPVELWRDMSVFLDNGDTSIVLQEEVLSSLNYILVLDSIAYGEYSLHFKYLDQEYSLNFTVDKEEMGNREVYLEAHFTIEKLSSEVEPSSMMSSSDEYSSSLAMSSEIGESLSSIEYSSSLLGDSLSSGVLLSSSSVDTSGSKDSVSSSINTSSSFSSSSVMDASSSSITLSSSSNIDSLSSSSQDSIILSSFSSSSEELSSSSSIMESSSSSLLIVTGDSTLGGIQIHEIPGIVEFEDFVEPGVAKVYGWPFFEADGFRKDKHAYPQLAGTAVSYPDISSDTNGVEFQSCYSDQSSNDVCISFLDTQEMLSYVVKASKKGMYNIFIGAGTYEQFLPGPYNIKLTFYDLAVDNSILEIDSAVIQNNGSWSNTIENKVEIELTDDFPETFLIVFQASGIPYQIDYMRFELNEEDPIDYNSESSFKECTDNLDNDGNGKINCDDPNCFVWDFCSKVGYVINHSSYFSEVKRLHILLDTTIVEAEDFIDIDLTLQKKWLFNESTPDELEFPGEAGKDYRQDANDYGVDLAKSRDSLGYAYVIDYIRRSEMLSYAVEVQHETTFKIRVRAASGFNPGDLMPPYALPIIFVHPENNLKLIESTYFYIEPTGGWGSWDFFNGNSSQNWHVDSSYFAQVTLPKGQWIMSMLSTEGAYSVNYFEFIEVQ